MRELGDRVARACLERVGQRAVGTHAAGQAQLVVERLADERVREHVAAGALLAHHLRLAGLLERGEHVDASSTASSRSTSNSRPATAARRRTVFVSSASREQPPADDVLDALGDRPGRAPAPARRRTGSRPSRRRSPRLPPIACTSPAVSPRSGGARPGPRGAGRRARPRADGCGRSRCRGRRPARAARSGAAARWASSRSVPASAQCRSSSSRTVPSSRAPIASKSRQRSPSASLSSRVERVRTERLGERLVRRDRLLVAAAVEHRSRRARAPRGRPRRAARLADAGSPASSTARPRRVRTGRDGRAAVERSSSSRGPRASRRAGRAPAGASGGERRRRGAARISASSRRVSRDGATESSRSSRSSSRT